MSSNLNRRTFLRGLLMTTAAAVLPASIAGMAPGTEELKFAYLLQAKRLMEQHAIKPIIVDGESCYILVSKAGYPCAYNPQRGALYFTRGIFFADI